MLSALALTVVTIVLELIPTAGMFIMEISKDSLTERGWIIMGTLFFAALVMNLIVLLAAMKTGEKRLINMES